MQVPLDLGGGLAIALAATGYAALNRPMMVCVKEGHSGSWCGWPAVDCSARESFVISDTDKTASSEKGRW
jgi:hypothetical protein